MYVAWVDLERTGRLKPVPCKEIKSFPELGEDMVVLREVEQIREPARGSMEVQRIIMRRQDIRYIVCGIDPADADEILTAKVGTEDDNEESSASEESSAEEADKNKPTETLHKAHSEHQHTGSDKARKWPSRFGNSPRPTNGGNF